MLRVRSKSYTGEVRPRIQSEFIADHYVELLCYEARELRVRPRPRELDEFLPPGKVRSVSSLSRPAGVRQPWVSDPGDTSPEQAVGQRKVDESDCALAFGKNVLLWGAVQKAVLVLHAREPRCAHDVASSASGNWSAEKFEQPTSRTLPARTARRGRRASPRSARQGRGCAAGIGR